MTHIVDDFTSNLRRRRVVGSGCEPGDGIENDDHRNKHLEIIAAIINQNSVLSCPSPTFLASTFTIDNYIMGFNESVPTGMNVGKLNGGGTGHQFDGGFRLYQSSI